MESACGFYKEKVNTISQHYNATTSAHVGGRAGVPLWTTLTLGTTLLIP